MKLILIRHGQTEENINRIMQGQQHGKLTNLGETQAKKVGKRLKDIGIDAIFSSDRDRCSNTTKEIIKYHKNVPVFYEKELRERNAGVYEGLDVDEYLKAVEEFPGEEEEFKPEAGESYKEMKVRVKNFIEQLLNKYPNKTVLLSTHGRWMKTFMNLYFGYELFGYVVGHTAVYEVDINEDGNHKIHLENCTKHLEP